MKLFAFRALVVIAFPFVAAWNAVETFCREMRSALWFTGNSFAQDWEETRRFLAYTPEELDQAVAEIKERRR